MPKPIAEETDYIRQRMEEIAKAEGRTTYGSVSPIPAAGNAEVAALAQALANPKCLGSEIARAFYGCTPIRQSEFWDARDDKATVSDFAQGVHTVGEYKDWLRKSNEAEIRLFANRPYDRERRPEMTVFCRLYLLGLIVL